MTHWFVVMAEPQWDVRVARDLFAQGFKTHVSISYRRDRYGREWFITAERWLSPYVFVGLAPGQGLKAVSETRGVSSILSFTPDPSGGWMLATEIDPELIESLRVAEIVELDELSRKTRRKESTLQIGDEIVVATHGHPLRDEIGKIVAMRTGFLWVQLRRAGFPWLIAESDVMPAHPFEGKKATAA